MGKGGPYKVYANNEVVAVNRIGTYSFAYLEPGEYMLASWTAGKGNLGGLKLRVDAGKEYYFYQDFIGGWGPSDTTLSMHSKELVSYEIGGAAFSGWSRK